MPSRKVIKQQARRSVRRHWGIWVLLCVVAMWIYGETIFINTGIELTKFVTTTESEEPAAAEDAAAAAGNMITETKSMSDQISTLLVNLLEGRKDENKELVQQNIADTVEASQGNRFLGRSRGVLSTLINRISSGSFVLFLTSGINSILHSDVATTISFILLSLLLMLAFWLLVQNIVPVVLARMFLEGHTYEHIHLNRLLYVFRSGYWVNTSFAMLRKTIFLLLWRLTIIGGFIKKYSYFAVPYILAENPSVSPKDAIALSRRMMYGYKWACFKLDLSFIGWDILNFFTFGVLNVVYARPYREAAYCEFFIAAREAYITSDIEYAKLLNDHYLYRKASPAHLASLYQEAVRVKEQTMAGDGTSLTGIYLFLAKYFGITLRNREAERKYTEHMALESRVYFEQQALEGQVYPARLSNIAELKNNPDRDISTNGLQSYSVWTLVMIFFTMSFIGWIWEVALHFISDGTFVNRGVLHGPWLPIYGTGGVVILVLLYRFRKNPALEFFLSMVVAGFVEYFTAYYLELTHDGKRWWDYTGYFLNLHGRICAEGLLVFGIAGMLVVYLLAPALDRLFSRIRLRYLIVICVVLLALYTVDNNYSHYHPNEGAGITDYTS